MLGRVARAAAAPGFTDPEDVVCYGRPSGTMWACTRLEIQYFTTDPARQAAFQVSPDTAPPVRFLVRRMHVPDPLI